MSQTLLIRKHPSQVATLLREGSDAIGTFFIFPLQIKGDIQDKRFRRKKYSWGVITPADNICSDCLNCNEGECGKRSSRFALAFPAWVVIAKWLSCGFENFLSIP